MTTAEEEAIIEQNRADVRAVAEEYGGWYKAPASVAMQTLEKARLRWCEWRDRRDATTAVAPEKKHDKSAKLAEYVHANIGAFLSIDDMMNASGCASGTAYKYIADNRSLFTKYPGGVYRVNDVEADRARDKVRPPLVVPPVIQDVPLPPDSPPVASDRPPAPPADIPPPRLH